MTRKTSILAAAVAILVVIGMLFFLYSGSRKPGTASSLAGTALLQQGKDLAAGWQAYKAKTQRPPVHATELLQAGLLPAFPAYPAAAGNVAAAPFSIAIIDAKAYAFADAGAPAKDTAPGKTDANSALCEDLSAAATGHAPAAYTAVPASQLVADPHAGNGTFGCGVASGNPPLVLPESGMFPVIGHYAFFYKLD